MWDRFIGVRAWRRGRSIGHSSFGFRLLSLGTLGIVQDYRVIGAITIEVRAILNPRWIACRPAPDPRCIITSAVVVEACFLVLLFPSVPVTLEAHLRHASAALKRSAAEGIVFLVGDDRR